MDTSNNLENAFHLDQNPRSDTSWDFEYADLLSEVQPADGADLRNWRGTFRHLKLPVGEGVATTMSASTAIKTVGLSATLQCQAKLELPENRLQRRVP